MAYTGISVYSATTGGTAITESSGAAGGAGTGYKFPNDGATRLLIRNTSTNTPTCTIVTGGTVKGRAIGDETISVGASGFQIVGPFEKEIYDQTSSDAGYIYIYFGGSNETELRVAAIA